MRGIHVEIAEDVRREYRNLFPLDCWSCQICHRECELEEVIEVRSVWVSHIVNPTLTDKLTSLQF